MRISYAISRYLDALTYAWTTLRNPAVLFPFLAFALVQWVILLAIANFTSRTLAPVMVPFLRFLGGEASLHYPMHMVGLPAVYQRLYYPLVATAGFALWSIAIWNLVGRHPIGRTRVSRPWRRSLPHMLVIGVLFVAASVAAGEGAARLLSATTPDLVARAVLILSVLATAIAQAFLIYAPVALRLRGGSAWNALRAGAGYARQHLLATMLVILTVLIVHLPVDFLLSRADRIAARFHPEAILQLMFLSAAVEVFTAYLLFAAVTELALPREGGLR